MRRMLPSTEVLTLAEAEATRARSGRAYHELLRREALSCGLYVLEAGAEDLQRPHAEDEVYVVLAGRARAQLDGEVREVGPGAVLFVARGVSHRFVDITERLELLVFFAPAETVPP